jgi:hypothetical protein
MEEWRPVTRENFGEVFEVSNLGNVRRTRPAVGPKKSRVSRSGYLRVNLQHEGREKTYAVHRLVAEAFIGPCPSSRHNVDHANRDKLDNRLENLRWADPWEQMKNSAYGDPSTIRDLREQIVRKEAELRRLRTELLQTGAYGMECLGCYLFRREKGLDKVPVQN